MTSFCVKGRVVSVDCSKLDPSVGPLELKVVLDHERDLDAANVHRLWLVDLPAELYEGRPHHIGLEVRSGERVLETASFNFVGSERILEPRALAQITDVD